MSKRKTNDHDSFPQEPPSLFDLFGKTPENDTVDGDAGKESSEAADAPIADIDEEAVAATEVKAEDDPDYTELDAGHVGGSGPMRDVMNDNFLQFATYSICNRAIPTVEDGLKPVQRRIMHALHELDDGRFNKVANVVGHTMRYHPHGDASIGDAVVTLVNRRHLIEGQGNYGSVITGDPAAAFRYIECRLTPLAREEIFNEKLTAFTPSYDGRNKEPVLLPAKIPILLMMGAEGISVGLSTNIFPHNFIELLEAQICIIQNKPFEVLPDFVTGGIVDASDYADGLGKIKVRSTIERRDKNKVVITSVPHGQTTESIISGIEEAVRKKKLNIREVMDLTAETVQIELTLAPGTSQDATIKSLYAFTPCESSISSRPVVLFKNRPCEMSVSDILRANTESLLNITRRELEIRAVELDDAFHDRTLEQIFIEERIYKRIEEEKTYEDVREAVLTGFTPFRGRLRRDVTSDDVERLLQIKIRRISRYDIEKNRQEIDGIIKEEGEVRDNLAHLRAYTVKYLKNLIKKHKADGARISEIATTPFKAIEIRALTASELSIRHDAENGYVGSSIRTGDELFKCSSLDKIIVVWDDGSYKMIPAPDKFFVDKNMLYCRIHNRDTVFTVVYTEPEYQFTMLKRFKFGGCIQNRDYRLAPEKSKIIFFQEGTPEALYVKYKPAKGMRVTQQAFDPNEILVKSVSARGKQMTSKQIKSISAERPRGWEDAPTDGFFS